MKLDSLGLHETKIHAASDVKLLSIAKPLSPFRSCGPWIACGDMTAPMPLQGQGVILSDQVLPSDLFDLVDLCALICSG